MREKQSTPAAETDGFPAYVCGAVHRTQHVLKFEEAAHLDGATEGHLPITLAEVHVACVAG